MNIDHRLAYFDAYPALRELIHELLKKRDRRSKELILNFCQLADDITDLTDGA